jgi:hypothetical protein
MKRPLSYRHRVITDDDIAFTRQLIADHPGASRWALSRESCVAWNWVQANGALRDMVCRGLMLMLHRQGLIELPPARSSVLDRAKRGPPPLLAVDDTPVQTSLADLGALEMRQVRRTPEEPLFNILLQLHHYLGYTQPVGEHLKYLVCAQGRPLACLALSSAPRHLGSRDRFIGWDKRVRLKNIALLAYNTRFLILPWVRVPHLASSILGRMTRMLSAEWQRVYAHPIYFVETFIDPQRFGGTCYRAANWQVLGQTTGRGKDDLTHKANRSIKTVLGYPLVKDFRQRLLQVAVRARGRGRRHRAATRRLRRCVIDVAREQPRASDSKPSPMAVPRLQAQAALPRASAMSSKSCNQKGTGRAMSNSRVERIRKQVKDFAAKFVQSGQTLLGQIVPLDELEQWVREAPRVYRERR